MVDSEFIPPLTTLGDQGDLRAALIRRVPYTFATTENPEDFTAVDAGTGSIPWALVWAGHIFYFDPNDLTTAHDGVTTIVTLDGYRYKVDGVAGAPEAVKSRSITSPPAGPALGDAYLVPVGASGDWATHPNNVALWTARGWEYIPPRVGQLVFVESEGGFYHYGTGGAWVAGIGGSALGPGTIRASSLIGGRSHWVVVNQTTNAPPPSPANGVAYIVGPAPTGAWAGQSGRIAVFEINAWAFYVPARGWTAFDQSLNTNHVYTTLWTRQQSGYADVRIVEALGTATPATSGSGTGTAPSATVPPTSSGPRAEDPIGSSVTIQADYPGQQFEVTYRAFTASVSFSGGGTGGTNTGYAFAIGLFIDSETQARDWAMLGNASGTSFPLGITAPDLEYSFVFSLSDVAPHQLKILLTAGRIQGSGTVSGTGSSNFIRRRLIIRKLA